MTMIFIQNKRYERHTKHLVTISSGLLASNVSTVIVLNIGLLTCYSSWSEIIS